MTYSKKLELENLGTLNLGLLMTSIHLVFLVSLDCTVAFAARGKGDIREAVTKYQESFNDYSKQTGANPKLTEEGRAKVFSETVTPAGKKVREDFYSVTRSALESRGVKIYNSAEEARSKSKASPLKSKIELNDPKLGPGMKVTPLNSEGKPVGRAVEFDSKGAKNARFTRFEEGGGSLPSHSKTGVEKPSDPGSEAVVVGGEQKVEWVTFPGKKKVATPGMPAKDLKKAKP